MNAEASVNLADPSVAPQLFGPQDQHLKLLRTQLGVSVTLRDGQLRLSGSDTGVKQTADILEKMIALLGKQGHLGREEVQQMIGAVTGVSPVSSNRDELAIAHPIRKIRPRTEGQNAYVTAIRQHDMTFCVGPAGCGKTYLAVATAVEALKSRQIRKIVLVRPAVEAGESLGFLPGDLQAKLNPYLRPLLDALNEMVEYDQVKFYMEQDIIEVIPLAYMRGRTLNQAFIILDEAQNTTVAQMKMFLTRMGEGSKIVVSGDTSQVDLPAGVTSGLKDAIHRLSGIPGIAFVQLGEGDIVRHKLVQQIVRAYDPAQRPGSGGR
jgi:phosphate starvation-inducible PhoH-like protein